MIAAKPPEQRGVGHRAPDVLQRELGRRQGREPVAAAKPCAKLAEAQLLEAARRVEQDEATGLAAPLKRSTWCSSVGSWMISASGSSTGSRSRIALSSMRQNAITGRAHALGAEARERLRVTAFEECGDRQHLGARNHALAASAVYANLDHEFAAFAQLRPSRPFCVRAPLAGVDTGQHRHGRGRGTVRRRRPHANGTFASALTRWQRQRGHPAAVAVPDDSALIPPLIPSALAVLYVAWQVTNECNLACLHCIEESGPGKEFRDELDRDAGVPRARAVDRRSRSRTSRSPAASRCFTRISSRWWSTCARAAASSRSRPTATT